MTMKKLALLFSLILICRMAFGQLILQPNVGFNPDPDLLEWALKPETFSVTIINTSNQTLKFKLRGYMTLNGERIVDNDVNKMPLEEIGPNSTEMKYIEDLLPAKAINLYGKVKETYLRTNQLPGGNYQICGEALDATGKPISPVVCRPFVITSFQQPNLIYPLATAPIMAMARPVFSWTPVTPTPNFQVVYRLRVVEVPDPSVNRAANADPSVMRVEYEAAIGAKFFTRADRKITGLWGVGPRNPTASAKSADPAVGPRSATAGVGPRNPTSTARQSTSNGQLSTEALRALTYGFPMIDMEVTNLNQVIWPPDVQEPLAGRSYAWSVQALRGDNGKPIGDNNGMSQPAQFFIEPEMATAARGSIGVQRPDFIIADENGCLYGCTSGVWQPIDCPEETRDINKLPKTFTLQSVPNALPTEKGWVLVDNRAPVSPERTQKPPLSNFALLDPARVPQRVNLDDASIVGNAPPISRISVQNALTRTKPIEIGIKNRAFGASETAPIRIVLDNSQQSRTAKPANTGGVSPKVIHIVLDNSAVLLPSTDPNARTAQSPIHIVIDNATSNSRIPFTIYKSAPLRLIDVAADGKLTPINALAEAKGIACFAISKCCDGEGGGQTGPPSNTAREMGGNSGTGGMPFEPPTPPAIWICDENGNNCFDFCTLPMDKHYLTPMVEHDPGGLDCLKFLPVTPMGSGGSIVCEGENGPFHTFNVDGTYEPYVQSQALKDLIAANKAQKQAAAGGGTEPTTQSSVNINFFSPFIIAVKPNQSAVNALFSGADGEGYLYWSPTPSNNNSITFKNLIAAKNGCYYFTVFHSGNLYTYKLPEWDNPTGMTLLPMPFTTQTIQFTLTLKQAPGTLFKFTITYDNNSATIPDNSAKITMTEIKSSSQSGDGNPNNTGTERLANAPIITEITPEQAEQFKQLLERAKGGGNNPTTQKTIFDANNTKVKLIEGQSVLGTVYPDRIYTGTNYNNGVVDFGNIPTLNPVRCYFVAFQVPGSNNWHFFTMPELCNNTTTAGLPAAFGSRNKLRTVGAFWVTNTYTNNNVKVKFRDVTTGGGGGTNGSTSTLREAELSPESVAAMIAVLDGNGSNTNKGSNTGGGNQIMTEPVPGAHVAVGCKLPPKCGNYMIVPTDQNGNASFDLVPELSSSYYIEYTPKSTGGSGGSGNNSTTKQAPVKPIRMDLPNFEKGWIYENNDTKLKKPIVVSKKLGDALVTVTYVKNGVRVNVVKAN
jgi:hypothetical protein